MRITNGMMMRKYGRNLNINLGRMNKTSEQIESGRRFHRASEDPVRALKALQVRRSLASLEQYGENIEAVDSWLTNTETAVSAIKSHADKAVDLIIHGKNDTLAPEDRLIIATALRNVQEALLKDLNAQVAGKYLLGGANTKGLDPDGESILPFMVDPDTGHLLFNGQDIFEINPEDYKNDRRIIESLETPVYVDLTGEFKLKGEEDNIEDDLVDKSTVFNMFTAGIDIIGVGPNNLYNLIGRVAHSLESEYIERRVPSEMLNEKTGEWEVVFHTVNVRYHLMGDLDGPMLDDADFIYDRESDAINDIIFQLNGFLAEGKITQEVYNREVALLDSEIDKLDYYKELYWEPYSGDGDGLFKKLQDAQITCLISLVNVGEKSNFIGYLKERNEEYIYQAEVMQNTLEVMPPDEAIMMFKMHDYIYKACLQMGSYIFQPSLMDYIRR